MSITIDNPEIEALIREWMATGAFPDVEALLLYALKNMPMPPVKK